MDKVLKEIAGVGGANAKLTISVKEYKGYDYIDIRVYANGFPTKKGLTLRDANSIPAICEGLTKAGEELIKVLKFKAEGQSNDTDDTPGDDGDNDYEPF